MRPLAGLNLWTLVGIVANHRQAGYSTARHYDDSKTCPLAAGQGERQVGATAHWPWPDEPDYTPRPPITDPPGPKTTKSRQRGRPRSHPQIPARDNNHKETQNNNNHDKANLHRLWMGTLRSWREAIALPRCGLHFRLR